jgi:predicted transcriptional regulator
LAETVKRAVELESFRAAELAEALGLSAQAVNNRLKAAQTAGAVTRERVVPEGGGKEFLYRAAIPVHA